MVSLHLQQAGARRRLEAEKVPWVTP